MLKRRLYSTLKADNLPFYKNGLKFSCTGCGKCCTGAPGHVWVNEEEIIKIAKHLNMHTEQFSKKYVRKVGNRFSLVEVVNAETDENDCVFLHNKKCKIYTVRPSQCKKYPFWPSILQSQEAWQAEAQECEGINAPNADLISYDKIEQIRKS